MGIPVGINKLPSRHNYKHMSKAEKTKAFIIEKSATTFNIKGYIGTSLSDVIELTGLTKGSIYGNFENKDELAVAAYHHNYTALMNSLDGAIQAKASALGQLMAFTSYYRQNWESIFKEGGCPVLNAATEADDNFEILKSHVQQSVAAWVGKICTIIETGQKNGEFKKEIISMAYAYTIITMLEGGIMLAKIMDSQHLLFLALDRIELIITNEIKK